LEKYLFPQPTLPFMHHFLFSLALALSAALLARANHLKRDWRMYLGFAVFVSFPSWAFITEFYANMPSVNFGIVCVALAVFIFSRTSAAWGKASLLTMGLQIVLLTLALGGYQAYMAVYLTMILGVLLTRAAWNDAEFSWRQAWFLGFQALLVMAFSFGLYRLILAAFMRGLALVPSVYIESYWNTAMIASNGLDILYLLLREAKDFYSGQALRYGADFTSLTTLWIFSLIQIVWSVWRLSISQKILRLGLWLGIFLSPFLLVLVSARAMPTRTLQALPYVVTLMSLMTLGVGSDDARPNRRPVFWGIALTTWLLFQSLLINNSYNARLALVQQFDRALAADLYTAMGAADSHMNSNDLVYFDVYGTPDFSSVYPSPWSGVGLGTSYFDWANRSVIETFMRINGYTNLRLLPDEIRKTLSDEFADMPVWPAPGYVRKEGQYLLVKLGRISDPLHASEK